MVGWLYFRRAVGRQAIVQGTGLSVLLAHPLPRLRPTLLSSFTDVDQLNQILQILGTPDDETLRRIGSDRALLYIRSLPTTPKVPFERLYPKASPMALDLLEKLLKFDPAARMTVEEALAHPYLEAYHDPEDEPTHARIFDFAFESVVNMGEIKSGLIGGARTGDLF